MRTIFRSKVKALLPDWLAASQTAPALVGERPGLFYGAHMRIEKWHEMTKRHHEERRLIIEYCKAHNMTQQEAAEFLGTSSPNLSRYMKVHKITWNAKKRKPRRTARDIAKDAW
jgi:DNA-binding NtrC family response regulator